LSLAAAPAGPQTQNEVMAVLREVLWNNGCGQTSKVYRSLRRMKRIAWILIAVFCTAFVRVPRVDLSPCVCCACCHCKVPGACGMPCSRTPGPAQATFVSERSTSVSRPVAQKARLGLPSDFKFYARYEGRPTDLVAFVAIAAAMPAGSVPLFKAHCSFLV